MEIIETQLDYRVVKLTHEEAEKHGLCIDGEQILKPKLRKYVMGFLFSLHASSVALIKKQRPSWMKYRWSGIGGKVEPGETSEQAMVREFREEAGILIPDWRLFCHVDGTHGGDNQNEPWEMDVFCSFSHDIDLVSTMTDEEVREFNTGCLPGNLHERVLWLIPMALSKERPHLVRRDHASDNVTMGKQQ